jgi:hypothetical protein
MRSSTLRVDGGEVSFGGRANKRHMFKIGQFVNYRPRLKSVGAGVYQIAQLMPPADDEAAISNQNLMLFLVRHREGSW